MWTNIFSNLEKYILKFVQIHFIIWINILVSWTNTVWTNTYVHCIIWTNILSMSISYQREVDAAPLRERIMTTGPGASLPPKESKNMLKFSIYHWTFFLFSVWNPSVKFGALKCTIYQMHLLTLRTPTNIIFLTKKFWLLFKDQR